MRFPTAHVSCGFYAPKILPERRPESLLSRFAAWKSVALCLGFASVVMAGLWVEKRSIASVRESRRAEERVNGVVVQSLPIAHDLADLYTAGIAPRGMEPGNLSRFEATRKRLSTSFGQIAIHLEGVPSERLQRLSEATAALVGEVERTTHTPTEGTPGVEPSLALEARYLDASSALQGLLESVQASARDLASRRLAAEEGADRTETFVLLLLLGVLGVATWLLWGMLRRMRGFAMGRQKLIAELCESEAKYRAIFDNAAEGIFQTSPDGRVLTANKALARMYGYRSPEHLIEGLTDIGTQFYADSTRREALLAALQENDVVSDFEFEVLRPDGRIVWLSENVRAVRDEKGELKYLEGTVKDVSDRWWGEQRRRLLYETARVFTESVSVAEARPRLLKTICEIVDWDLGAVWDVNVVDRQLECVEIWHSPEVDVTEFEQANFNATHPLTYGLAGEVWRTGESKWIGQLTESTRFANVAIAVKAGMRSAYGIPVMVRGEVRHVLEFFSPKTSLPNAELLHTLTAISSQLGQLIERKAAEEALRTSEMRKGAILQSALDCIISYDEEGGIREWNPAAERAFGFRQSEVLGWPVDEVILPKGKRESQRAFLGLGDEGYRVIGDGRRLELVLLRHDGREFPADVAISRITIDDEPMYTAYLRDASERKKADRATSELAAVVANSNDAILGCTLDGIIRSWNAGAERIFGYSPEEAIDRPLHMLIPSDRIDEFPQMLTTVQRGESLANYETIRLRKDGKKINVSVTDSPIRGEGGLISGLSSIARDITERKRLEEALLQSQKMEAVGRLAGGIAHDFNNILTAVLGYSDLLIGQIEERHWMWKNLHEIRKAAEFASSLTQQLLAFSRRQPLYPRVFCINDSIARMEKMLQRVIGEHFKVRATLNARSGRVKADPSQIEQVLLNLCVNARDAMANGGSVAITSSDVTYEIDETSTINEMPAGEYVKLTVSDTGTGIAPEVLKHIFEPFFTTKDKGKGTGLGLATCYGIVKQSGGYIGVDSTLGVGTTFSIYLPRVEESGALVTPVKQLGALQGGTETILYVEDEITVRSLTAHVLRRLGYTVLEAGDGAQARDLMESTNSRPVDLLLADIVLPDSGGRELSEWVRRQSTETRILLCSGYVDENMLKRHGLEIGTAFLQKPFTPADLAQKVREVIESPN